MIEGIAKLRQENPVFWLDGLGGGGSGRGFGAWLVTRYDDVHALLADPRVTPNRRHWEGYRPPPDTPAGRWLAQASFFAAAPDEHRRHRRLVSSALTPRAVARIEQQIADVVTHFETKLLAALGSAAPDEAVDFHQVFFAPIPGTVIGRITGVPPKGDDEARFRTLASRILRGLGPMVDDGEREDAGEATLELCEYVEGLVRRRKESPREDLVSDLARVVDEEGEATSDEIVRIVSALVTAGTETTALAAAHGLRSLLRHPEALAQLREAPELMPNAVRELLRFDSGLPGVPRYALEGFTLRGQELRRGQLLVLSFAGAHRDPAVFPDPDRLDLARDTSRILVFGRGTHFCLGSSLAQTEVRLMLERALANLPPGARLRESAIRTEGNAMAPRLVTLPIDFDRDRDLDPDASALRLPGRAT